MKESRFRRKEKARLKYGKVGERSDHRVSSSSKDIK